MPRRPAPSCCGCAGGSIGWSAAWSAFRGGSRVWHQVDVARLWLRPFSDEYLAAYLAAAGPGILGCVGAYELEGLGAQLIGRVEGDYFTILGLPLLPLLQFLRDQGVLERMIVVG